MKPFPHLYEVSAEAAEAGRVELSAPGLATLESDGPVEFDGPGDRWSPEMLLVGAAADCFILTFRAIARASKLPWIRLSCGAKGTLDRVERETRFTALELDAELVVPAGSDLDRARRLLEKAERGCLITSSLKLEPVLRARVREP